MQFLDPPDPDAVMIGLANEYASYVTTPEEYMPQDYSAASTLWGPNEGPYIGCNLAQLASFPPSSKPNRELKGRTYYPGTAEDPPFGPGFLGEKRLLPSEGIEMVLKETHGLPDPSLPWFRWPETSDGSCPEDVLASDFKAAAWRRLSIEEWDGTSWVPRHTNCTLENDPGLDDDTGFNLLTVLMDGSARQDRTYAGVWLRPLRGTITGNFRFKVHRPDATYVCSQCFISPRPIGARAEILGANCDNPSPDCK
jgi:hypothetical protein